MAYNDFSLCLILDFIRQGLVLLLPFIFLFVGVTWRTHFSLFSYMLWQTCLPGLFTVQSLFCWIPYGNYSSLFLFNFNMYQFYSAVHASRELPFYNGFTYFLVTYTLLIYTHVAVFCAWPLAIKKFIMKSWSITTANVIWLEWPYRVF